MTSRTPSTTTTAIECAPDYALAHNNLAYFLKKNKRDLEGAEKHYREAIRCDPALRFLLIAT